MTSPPIENACIVAEYWAEWCGTENQWYKKLKEFGELGGKIQWWCGYPQSASAIPLTFALFTPNGEKLPSNYRLKDIRTAIETISA